jgi:uncharacterized membrane protein
MRGTFSTWEILRSGWGLAKKNFGSAWLLLSVTALIAALPDLTEWLTPNSGTALLAGAFSLALGLVVDVGLTSAWLRMVDGGKAGLPQLFSRYRLAFRNFTAGILYFLVTFGPPYALLRFAAVFREGAQIRHLFLFFAVVSLVWTLYVGIRFQFYTYLIVDRNLGVIESLRESARLTRRHAPQLGALLFVIVLVNLAGVLAFLVGILFAVPSTALAHAYAYRRLSGGS